PHHVGCLSARRIWAVSSSLNFHLRWDTWSINCNLDLVHESDLQVRETTFLRLKFHAVELDMKGDLIFLKKLSSALTFVRGKFLPYMGCHMVAL
ncbi:hypothetical protein BHE74_00054406, partial [Ensete ventricosum]